MKGALGTIWTVRRRTRDADGFALGRNRNFGPPDERLEMPAFAA